MTEIESGALPASWPDLAELGPGELAELIQAARAEERVAVAEQVGALSKALRLVLNCPECGGGGDYYGNRGTEAVECNCRKEARAALSAAGGTRAGEGER